MSNKNTGQDPLQQEAAARLAGSASRDAPAQNLEELLHELRVHQIELEMQNDELRRAQLAVEESRDRYVDLYEFAPVGYLTLTRAGQIAKANLTASALLGVERSKLLKRRFAGFIADDRASWNRHFSRTLQSDALQSCEHLLKRSDGTAFHARLDCVPMRDDTAAMRVALTDISERKRAELQSRDLSAHLQNAREEEKARIARDIHDELGSLLVALKMDAALVHRLTKDSGIELLMERSQAMQDMLDQAVQTMHQLITDLRPPMLDELGLMAALEYHAKRFGEHTGIECRVAECAEQDCPAMLDTTLSINLFRIFQEAVTNVARHAQASRVDVDIHCTAGTTILTICDNGRGLAPGFTSAPSSYGMRSMRERANLLGGVIEFENTASGGLKVTVTVPLPGACRR